MGDGRHVPRDGDGKRSRMDRNQEPHEPNAARLQDRLTAARNQRFVGRTAELELFRDALLDGHTSTALLYIHGPGGVGKTSLLRQYAQLATQAGRPCISLDSRNISASPPAFEAALLQMLAPADAASLDQALTHVPDLVLLIDTYEQIASLDAWMRERFLPALPPQALVVVAGRTPPDAAWQTDEGWRALGRFLHLGNLAPDECHRYLTGRGIPAAAHAAALDFTHGHPLALSLVADLYGQDSATATLPAPDERGVIDLLLGRFMQDVATPQQREALELAAIALTSTEDLLRARFGDRAGHDLFRWLRGLNFVEQGPYGLFPHDLVREVLVADLHWRSPATYADYQQTILTYLRQRHWQSSGYEQQRYSLDIIFVNRRAPGMKDFFAWDEMDRAYAEPATVDDFPAILDMVRLHEGDASAAIAAHWQARQPDAFLAYRTNDGKLYGFMAQLALERVTAEDVAVDPGVGAVMAWMQARRPLTPGQAASFMRFWMAADTYQAVSPAINLSAANCVIHWRTTPGLVWSFVAMAHPDFMAPHFESIRFPRTPGADFQLGGRSFGVFSHDWIQDPPHRWQVDTKHADELSLVGDTAPSASRAHLPDEEFADAVRHALRDFTRPDQLATNPLLNSALLGDDARTADALRGCIAQAVTSFSHNPRDAKLYRALWYTYIEPRATQEQTAEFLDLPFNTYRYHLNTGLARLTAALQQQATAQQ